MVRLARWGKAFFLLAGLTLAGLLLSGGCSGGGGEKETEVTPAANASVDEGHALYRAYCLECHGEDGDRIPISPLSSRPFLDSRGDATLLAAVAQGKGTMPAFAREHGGPLTDQQVRSLIAYVNSGAGRTTTALLANSGEELYTAYCAACHGPQGDRIPIAPLDAKGFLDARSDERLLDVVLRGKGNMPGLAAAAGGPLTQADATALVSFVRYRVQELAAERVSLGRDLYVGNCLTCHGTGGDKVEGVELASAPYLTEFGDGRLIAAINDGTATGPAFGPAGGGAFAITDMAALLSYLKSWAGLNATAALTSAGAGGLGESLFLTNCSPCHGATGDQVPGVMLKSGDFLSRETRDVVVKTIKVGNDKGMPAWGVEAGGPLTDEQVESVAGYLFAVSGADSPGTAASTSAPTATATVTPAGSGPAADPGAPIFDGKTAADFFAANCSPCHGANREGKIGPALLPERLTESDQFYVDTIANGRAGTPMPSWSARGVTDEQIRALVAFIKSDPDSGPSGPSATPSDEPLTTPTAVPIPFFGEELFKNICAACHGQDGLAIPQCPLGSREWIGNMSFEGLLTRISRGKPSMGMPTWSQKYGGPLTDEQIRSVAEYLGRVAR